MKEPKIELIEMNLIDPNPDNDTIFNMDAIEYLAKGIKDEGFIGSIEVFQKPDGRYEISSGHRRYKAMELLRETKIPCTIIHSLDNVSKAQRLLSSNLKNRILKPMDFARAIRYYKENVIKPQNIKGKTEVMCKDYFNMSISSIKRLETLLNLIPELQQLTDSDGFPYTALSAASTLSPTQQRELYNRIIDFTKQNETNSISGLRINQIVESIRVRDNYKKQENGITKKDTLGNDQSVTFTKKPPVLEMNYQTDISSRPIVSSEDMMNMSALTKDKSEREEVITTVEYMDHILDIYTDQFQNLVESNYQIDNSIAVQKNINKLKKVISVLESKLNK